MMKPCTLLRVALLFTGIIPWSKACMGSDSTWPFEFGPDEYPDLETVGYNINHIGLNVANLTASLHFYVDLIGMRHIFTYHATPYFKIAYVGHIAGGYNGTGYQTPLELNRQKNNMKGLIEFVYIAPDATDPPPETPLASTRKSNTFSHVGLVVPDIEATQKRLTDANVTILKGTGAEPSSTGPLPNAYGLGLLPPGSDQIAKTIIQGLAAAGGVSFIMAEDPDGNLLEIQPQY